MAKRIVVTLALVAALMGFTQGRAEASLITLNVGQTANFLYLGPLTGQPNCLLCSATGSLTLNSSTQITLNFSNTSTDGVSGLNILTGIGFNTSPTLDFGKKDNKSATGWTNLASIIWTPSTLNWSIAPQGGGLGGFELVASSNQGITNGLDGGGLSGSVVITFVNSILNGGSTLAIDLTAVHIQALLGGGSTKFGGCVAGTPGCGQNITPIPEPATLLLLGSGLGLAAARLRRRRSP